MQFLPEELLALICEHCSHSSQKTLRLVDKRWSAVSTPFVFEHFYMGVFEDGLDKLDNVSRSHSIATHVKSFTIYADIIPMMEKTEWLAAIDFRPRFSSWFASRARFQARSDFSSPFRTTGAGGIDYMAAYDALPRHNLGEDELGRAWHDFLAYRREQREWRQDQQGMRLKEALTSLPNLVEANVSCTTPFSGGRTNEWPVFNRLQRTILVGPDDWRYSTDHFDPDYAVACGHAALALTEAVGYRATFCGLKPVTRLLLRSSHLGAFEDLTRFQSDKFNLVDILGERRHTTARLPMTSARHQLRVDAFRGLFVLKLHIPHATLSTRCSGLGLQAETIDFLKAATSLRDLDLRYTDDELSPDDELPQLEDLFTQDLLWPNIERLSLATNVGAEVLLGFLARHSTTLRQLELKDMLITDVEVLLRELPTTVVLRHVYAECLWDYSPDGEFLSVLSRGTSYPDPYERQMEAYLLGESVQMPSLEWDGARGSEIIFNDDENVGSI